MTDAPSSSTSSSGHVDGLGWRSLSFDRETGAVLERLHLRPELGAFEHIIRQRAARLASLEDERFARPSTVERDSGTGEWTVVAEFIAGSRMSELLETSAETAFVPGVDVALGYLLDCLPALSTLHTGYKIAHGVIDPSRTVITSEGQVVFLDVAVGGAVERLNLTRSAMWSRFGVGAASGDGDRVRFDPLADLTQVSMSALMLILGRNLRADEYPDALPSLLMEVIEVAQIRGTAGFAGGLQKFLQRSLPIPGRRPYESADEALVEIRQLVRREIGVDVCRKAVVDFVEQMEAAFSTEPSQADHDTATPAPTRFVAELDAFLDNAAAPASQSSFAAREEPAAEPVGEDEDEGEVEISLDGLSGAERKEPVADAEEIYDLSSMGRFDASDMSDFGVVQSKPRPVTRFPAPAPEPAYRPEPAFEPPVVAEPEPEPAYAHYDPPAPVYEPEPEPVAAAPVVEPVYEPSIPEPVFAAPAAPIAPEPVVPEPAPVAYEPIADDTRYEPEPAMPAPFDSLSEPESASPLEALEPSSADGDAEPEKESGSWRRKKRHQQKSARARKDKLRSTTAPKAPIPMPPPEPAVARPSSPTGWLVSPQRAAAFEPPVADPHPVPAPAAVRPMTPSVPSFSPSPVGPLPQPIYTPQTPSQVYGKPTTVPVVQPSPLTPMPVPQSTPATQVRVKSNPPIGFTPPRKITPIEPPPVIIPDRSGTMAPLGLNRPDGDAEETRGFPWKLAAIAVGVAIVAIVAGRSYLPGRAAVAGEPGAQAQTTAPAPPPAAPPEDTPDTPIPAGRGRLVVTTQPAGIKVLLDRKPVGETPLKIDVPAGRRMLSFMTAGGEVMRSVKVVAGKAQTLDVPVFSGWVAVFAPVVLDVAENGKSIGTTEQNRLMLPPGPHQLTLSNKELGYSSVEQVEVEPGGVKSLNIDAKGSVSLNASPWAEVWLDNKKIGDTPLVTQVPIGTREFVFKHPQQGERRVTATVKASGSSPISVDYSK